MGTTLGGRSIRVRNNITTNDTTALFQSHSVLSIIMHKTFQSRPYRVLNSPFPFLATCVFCTSVMKSFIFPDGPFFSRISFNSAGFRLTTPRGKPWPRLIQTMVLKPRKMKAVLHNLSLYCMYYNASTVL